MSSYSELVKNFEKVRAYMRDFYVYGLKSRSEYDKKSARSYDDERRRIESWLGEHMGYTRTTDGKNMFISIDSRICAHNPLYRSLKAKSFTDKDITLHFILFDILSSPDISLTLSEILCRMDDYLGCFENPMMFDESTVRKKLGEYIREGIIVGTKQGRTMLYSRSETVDISCDTDAVHFFSETVPCGVVGSFLLDKLPRHSDNIFFKHHYITSALDSDVLASLFDAMHRKCEIAAVNTARHTSGTKTLNLVPLRIFISVQSGRQHLLAYQPHSKKLGSFRLDYLSDVKIGQCCAEFDHLRSQLDHCMQYMWGVNCRNNESRHEHVEFTIRVEDGEQHIVHRLEREKRIGTVEKIDDKHYRFLADVYDTSELIPWIRTFICRITKLDFSDRTTENRLRRDIGEMYKMYGIDGGDTA